jgi:hypothetical protein
MRAIAGRPAGCPPLARSHWYPPLRHAPACRQSGLSDAGHLEILHAIWASKDTPARGQWYQGLLNAALPPGY